MYTPFPIPLLYYPKNGVKSEKTLNCRKGQTSKKVRSSYGELELTIPHDREGEFEPAVARKRQKEVTGIEEQIIVLYAKRISVRDIQTHLNQLSGVEVFPILISNVKKSRPLCVLRRHKKAVKASQAGLHRFHGADCFLCLFFLRY